MQVCGYAARKQTGVGHVALWFPTVGHLPVDCCFTTYASRHRVSVPWFLSYPMLLGYGSLHIVEAEACGSRRILTFQDGSRLLEIRFCQLHVSLGFIEFRKRSVVVRRREIS